jgi:molybdopterin molybdotransferase
VSAGTELKAGQIYESNAIMLAAAVREAGGEVVATPPPDDVTQFSAVLEGYSGQADLIITTGGVSAGAYEVVKDAFGAGAVDFVKVAMQPGMPQGAGRVTGAAGPATSAQAPIVTLPGNPVSALVSFEVFVRPALRAAMGLPSPLRPRRPRCSPRT